MTDGLSILQATPLNDTKFVKIGKFWTALGDVSLQNEWATGRMWAQNGDLELGKF